jgi:hypothetical protein
MERVPREGLLSRLWRAKGAPTGSVIGGASPPNPQRISFADRKTKSAVRDIDSEAAQRGFLVLFMHVLAGLAHRLDADIKADKVLAVAP